MDVRLTLDASARRLQRHAAGLSRGITVNAERPPLFSASPRENPPRNAIERRGHPLSSNLEAGAEQA
jgi:hypothetical protein